MEVEQLQRVIENLTSDCESLKRQVAAEKDCARNLEFIIKTGRQQVKLFSRDQQIVHADTLHSCC